MNKRILLVDDDVNILNAHLRNLRFKFEIRTSTSGEEGLKIVQNSDPFAVVVSDYRMPEMDGIKFLTSVRNISPDSVRIMLTGYADVNAAIETINEGNVFRFLTKPCQNEMLVKALNDGIEQYRLITSEKELFEKTLRGSIKVLIDILALVNPIAFSKAARLRNIVKKLGKNLEESLQWKLEIAALLSQIGCVALPIEILEKKTNNLTLSPKEKELYLSHPQIGKSLLANIPRLEEISDAIAFQFKRYSEQTSADNEKKDNPVAIIARLLKHAVDLDTLIEAEKKDKNGIEYVKTKYDEESDTVNIEVSDLEKNYVMKSMLISGLVPGMIIYQDIIDKNGLSLVGRGTEVSDVLILRLASFVSLRRINEPIRVYVLKETE